MQWCRLAANEIILSYDIIFKPRTPKGYTDTKKIKPCILWLFFTVLVCLLLPVYDVTLHDACTMSITFLTVTLWCLVSFYL